MNNRKFLRFDIPLQVEARNQNRESFFGKIINFSRQGVSVVFDSFNFEPNTPIELKIQRPGRDIFVPALGQVMWKRDTGGAWQAGIKLLDMPAEVKIEILEYGYDAWLKSSSRPLEQ